MIRSLRPIGVLTGLLALAATGGPAAAEPMPFIEVAPAVRTAFRERGTGRPFVMVGVNYFDHRTGWAPKLWQQFDEQRVREQLTRIRGLGLNTIRVFLTLQSFHREAGQVTAEGEAKFRRMLAICRDLGIYVMPTGPDHWEGRVPWRGADPFADEAVLKADEAWWAAFAGRFRDEPAIVAWDLLNEPAIGWDTPAMRAKWNTWLMREYGTVEAIATAWARPVEQVGRLGEVAPPPREAALNDARLYDYQRFREHIGDEWTRRLAEAIRSADPNHLVTVGHVQWAVPILLPMFLHYAGFDLRSNERHVDFATVHFYPLAAPWPSHGPDGMEMNATYLESLLYLSTHRRPLVLGEFGWYGGGELRQGDRVEFPHRPQEHQAEWCGRLLEISRGRLAGWLNWAYADTPTSTDLSRFSGLWDEDEKLKVWGRAYGRFAESSTARPATPREYPAYLTGFRFDRRAMVTSHETGVGYLSQLNALRRAATRPAATSRP